MSCSLWIILIVTVNDPWSYCEVTGTCGVFSISMNVESIGRKLEAILVS